MQTCDCTHFEVGAFKNDEGPSVYVLKCLKNPVKTLQPSGTLPCLQNLVASPVRHAELGQEDHWHYTVDRERL